MTDARPMSSSGSTVALGRFRKEATGRETAEARLARLSSQQKAAIVISALGPADAEPLLKALSDDEVRHFARAAASLGEISSIVVETVVSEFIHGLSSQDLNVSSDRLKEILASVLSEDAIERILEDLDESDGRSIWEKLSNSDPVDLGNYLAREHAQTAAVVISRIRPDSAAKVMQRFEPAFAEEVVMRLSKVSLLGSAVMDAVKENIENDFLRGARLQKSKRKPDELIGSIFNYMQAEKRDELLRGVEAQSAELATAIQRKMFTFGDIPKRVDRANISVILREVENTVLLMALAAAKKNYPETPPFFLENMSRRLAEQMSEQIDEMPAPNAREGEEAQFAVVNVIRALGDKGEITLITPEEDLEA